MVCSKDHGNDSTIQEEMQMTTIEIVLIGLLAMLLIMLYWVGAIFYAIQKGFNQVVKGLESIDARLARLEEKK